MFENFKILENNNLQLEYIGNNKKETVTSENLKNLINTLKDNTNFPFKIEDDKYINFNTGISSNLIVVKVIEEIKLQKELSEINDKKKKANIFLSTLNLFKTKFHTETESIIQKLNSELQKVDQLLKKFVSEESQDELYKLAIQKPEIKAQVDILQQNVGNLKSLIDRSQKKSKEYYNYYVEKLVT